MDTDLEDSLTNGTVNTDSNDLETVTSESDEYNSEDNVNLNSLSDKEIFLDFISISSLCSSWKSQINSLNLTSERVSSSALKYFSDNGILENYIVCLSTAVNSLIMSVNNIINSIETSSDSQFATDSSYSKYSGTKSSNSFIKPKGIDLKFVVPDNTTHLGFEMMDIANAARGKIIYEKPDEQIYDSKTCKVVPNYWLDGKREMHLGQVSNNPVLLANHIKELKNEGCTSNVMVLNPNAKNIQLTDVLQGLNDTFGRVPELISSNCRGDYSSGEEFPEKRTVVRED